MHFGALLFPEVVPRDSRLSGATAAGRPVVLYDMHSVGSLAYRKLAERLIEKHRASGTAANP